jgi:xanthine dehydrogenase small subunit
MRDFIQFYLNGKVQKVSGQLASSTLSDYLRYQKGLRGTKVVCAEGDCGACTVMVGELTEKLTYRSINSCIAMVALMDGKHVVTIEGLGSADEPHEIQKRMVENNGAQCGYCTPGFVMSLTDLYEHKEDVTEKHCRNYLTGNLCRCTGYGSIIDAALAVDPKKSKSLGDIYKDVKFENTNDSVEIKTKDFEFYSPTSLKEALGLKKKYPGIRIISAATDLGVQINKDRFEPHRLLFLDKVPETHQLVVNENEVTIGARVHLSSIEKAYEGIEDEFSNFLKIFASPQIKNFGTLIGNVANASPIGDCLPFLSVMNATVSLISESGRRDVLFKNFYLGYKKLDMLPEELILSVSIPRRSKNEVLKLYKVSRRKDLDISAVNAAIKMTVTNGKIEKFAVAYGGVGPTTLRLPILEKKMIGLSFDANNFRAQSHEIKNEISPMSDVRGSSEYRHLVAKNLFQRFFLEASKEVAK